MVGFFRWLLSPFVSVFYISSGLWNRSGDWGWHISLRIFFTVLVFGLGVFFFAWAFVGFDWPPFGI